MSISEMLSQALHSNDNTLLEACFAQTNTSIINATVMKLPAMHVLAFLNAISERIQTSPNRGAPMTAWLRAVFVHHATFLSSLPDLTAKIGGLYQVLHARAQNVEELERLRGRLDLLSSQMKMKRDAAKRTKAQVELDPILALQASADGALPPHVALYQESDDEEDSADEMQQEDFDDDEEEEEEDGNDEEEEEAQPSEDDMAEDMEERVEEEDEDMASDDEMQDDEDLQEMATGEATPLVNGHLADDMEVEDAMEEVEAEGTLDRSQPSSPPPAATKKEKKKKSKKSKKAAQLEEAQTAMS